MILSEQIAEAKVLDVLWTASKDGFLKPRVQIEEVNIGGAKINYATGFNAKFIEDLDKIWTKIMNADRQDIKKLN